MVFSALIGFNHSGLKSFIEGPISLFQDSNWSCPEFSILSVLRLFGLSDISNLNQICDVIRKFVSLLEKIHPSLPNPSILFFFPNVMFKRLLYLVPLLSRVFLVIISEKHSLVHLIFHQPNRHGCKQVYQEWELSRRLFGSPVVLNYLLFDIVFAF